MLGRMRVSGETLGLLVAWQNAGVVPEMKGSLWSARKTAALRASSGLRPLILCEACLKGWDTGPHSRGAEEYAGLPVTGFQHTG